MATYSHTDTHTQAHVHLTRLRFSSRFYWKGEKQAKGRRTAGRVRRLRSGLIPLESRALDNRLHSLNAALLPFFASVSFAISHYYFFSICIF